MRPSFDVALRTMTALVLAAALPALARAAPRRVGHVDVGGDPDCVACHRAETPDVVQQWNASPHGVALVKCFVCHGSTGEDFRARPDTARCAGCHAAQAGSLAKRPVKDCFACHAPHALSANPHR